MASAVPKTGLGGCYQITKGLFPKVPWAWLDTTIPPLIQVHTYTRPRSASWLHQRGPKVLDDRRAPTLKQQDSLESCRDSAPRPVDLLHDCPGYYLQVSDDMLKRRVPIV